MCHDMLLNLGEELLGFGESESQLFDLVAAFLQYRHVVDRVRSIMVSANNQLDLHPHIVPSPLSLLAMELTLLRVKGYPRFLMLSVPVRLLRLMHQVDAVGEVGVQNRDNFGESP